ncbi:hypothetical protein SMA5143A_8240 [Streptomyces sp. MA5143a]|nr:hypothetical protein SMA5143A_8240 [Streptomyces sp. MA5143a]
MLALEATAPEGKHDEWVDASAVWKPYPRG